MFNASTAKECKDCGVPFLPQRESSRKADPTTCGFVAEGMNCGHRGVLSEGTTGEGSWYCREHWDVIRGVPTTVRGNGLPARKIDEGKPRWEYSGWHIEEHKPVFATVARALRSMRPVTAEQDA
jgi:hypothetical protein